MRIQLHLAGFYLGLGLLVPGLASFPGTSVAACSLTSSTYRVALLELYTSEGCSSCPPADRWLSSLATSGFGSDKLVPLALHVDYWNGLGWTDRFSKAGFSQRQREAAERGRIGVIYTPQVVLDGADLTGWGNAGRFASTVASVNKSPPGADIRLTTALAETTLRLDGEVRVEESMRRAAVGAWVAVFENRLVTRVAAGENGGRTLEHDYVVRALLGPIAVGRDGIAKLNLQLPLDATWNRSKLGVAAFVQDSATGSVFQAVSASNCI
jgi:hypothetical protein